MNSTPSALKKSPIDFSSAKFRDQIFGCWMGKNCGGTLGGPLEKGWAEEEPFDVWWYPKLQEGGIPNDDLEMQLIWLKALEEVGPDLKAADLAQYWLDHIVYNWDEYGLSKTNIRMGMVPPISGKYNNWFRDYMGCPIRSEIWACIAPGAPRIAVRYAYEDAIVDHAGGESVYGEFFNTAVESAAFLISDKRKLIEIGMSYLPEYSETRRMIKIAVDAYDSGKDWKEARRLIMAATTNRVAQYSPPNIAFQIVGWLYAKDFVEAICIATNCGWDTDCTAATVGSYIGIILGGKGLPEKWTAPLGDSIATNESNGGLRHTTVGTNPIPKDLHELTDRTIAMAQKVMSWHGNEFADPSDISTFMADDYVRALWKYPSSGYRASKGNIIVDVDYQDTPALTEKSTKNLSMLVTNPHPVAQKVTLSLTAPKSWNEIPSQTLEVPAEKTVTVKWAVQVPAAKLLENVNRIALDVVSDDRPAQPSIPLVMPGARKVRLSQLFPAGKLDAKTLLDTPFETEEVKGNVLTPNGRKGTWTELAALENDLPIQSKFQSSGVLYLQAFIWSETETSAYLCSPSTCAQKIWFNQELLHEDATYQKLRPAYAGRANRIVVKAGWNEVLLKLVRGEDAPAFEGHLTYGKIKSDDLNLHTFIYGTQDLLWTRFPWD